MKREINLYTCVLMLLGLYVLYIFIHQFTLPIPLYAWFITALGIPFSVLPFRLPSGVTWSGAVVIYVYLESLYGCHLSLFAMVITTTIAFVITTKTRALVQWTRLLATYGMYGLSIVASMGVVRLCAGYHIFHVVTSLLGVVVYEVVNLLLFLGIQRSMGRTNAFFKIYTHFQYYPILFGSVVLAHLQSFTQPTMRFEESAWSAFLLFLFVVISNGYARVDRLRKDGEKKYRIIADYTSDLICVLDDNAVVTYASPSHQATLGMSPESMEGRAFMDTMNVTDAILLKAAFEAATRYRVAQRIELHSRDSLSSFDSQISPVIESDGSVRSFVTVSRDMTEQRRTERLLRRSDRLALVGQLAAGIAHEIRNPLTSLKGFLQLFQPKLADKPIQYQVMWSELERIEEIIKEFLVLAKPASQEDATSENLYEIILEVTRLLEAQANLSNVEMKLEENLSVPAVYCHPNQ